MLKIQNKNFNKDRF